MNISVEDTIKGLQQNHIQSSTLDYEFGILCDPKILRISKALELEETESSESLWVYNYPSERNKHE
jgi:hypothetical protein